MSKDVDHVCMEFAFLLVEGDVVVLCLFCTTLSVLLCSFTSGAPNKMLSLCNMHLGRPLNINHFGLKCPHGILNGANFLDSLSRVSW